MSRVEDGEEIEQTVAPSRKGFEKTNDQPLHSDAKYVASDSQEKPIPARVGRYAVSDNFVPPHQAMPLVEGDPRKK